MSAEVPSIKGRNSDTFTLDAEGGFTLSDDLRAHLGVASGGRLQVIKLAGGRIGLKAAPMGPLAKFVAGFRRLLFPT